MKLKIIAVCSLLLCALLLVGCAPQQAQILPTPTPAPLATATPPPVQSADLMAHVQANAVSGRAVDEEFTAAYLNFAVELFQRTAGGGENTMISPLSVQVALAMTANGAQGKTLQEMETVLGGLKLNRLNDYLHAYMDSLPNEKGCKLRVADSVWFRDTAELRVKEDFLQTNADYYGAAAYRAAFDEQTLQDINAWVNRNTDGMIPEILKEISPDAMLYLINAVLFQAQWQEPYAEENVIDGKFTALSGEKQTVPRMHSREHLYLSGEREEGFLKYYQGGRYAFAALLPRKGIDFSDYLHSLTAAGLQQLLRGAECTEVRAVMPKFRYSYEKELKDLLSEMGMPTAFDGSLADFTRMAQIQDSNLYLDFVLHKTFIEVQENGTRAAAVTVVGVNKATSVQQPEQLKTVTLDRPFVYLILDTQTNLPIFMGTVTRVTF